MEQFISLFLCAARSYVKIINYHCILCTLSGWLIASSIYHDLLLLLLLLLIHEIKTANAQQCINNVIIFD